METLNPMHVSDAVGDRHFDTVKAITKSFIDNTNE